MALSVPDETEALVDRLRSAAEYMYQFDVYRETFEEAGLTPEDIDSIETFRSLPAMEPKELAEDFEANPPWGSLVADDRPVVRCNFTPSPHMDSMPVLWTERDKEIVREETADAFRSVGISEDDIVLNTGGLAPHTFGWSVADAVEHIGATHIPSGPGDTERQINTIKNHGVTAIVGFPSFVEKIANESDETLDGVDIIIGSGEPFTAIDGYRERVRQAYGGDVTVVDGYGLAEFGGGWVAMESEREAGMVLQTGRVFPEVINPETGELVERGEKGELVLTTLLDESAPLLRCRTGDLTLMEAADSEHGEYVLSEGVFGRTDGRKKVKGIKLYPSELQMHLAGVPGVDPRNVQVHLYRPEGSTDRIDVTVGGDPEEADHEAVRADVESVLGLGVDDFEISEGFEVEDSEMVVDDR